jgi:hypothetical protein
MRKDGDDEISIPISAIFASHGPTELWFSKASRSAAASRSIPNGHGVGARKPPIQSAQQATAPCESAGHRITYDLSA